MGRIRRLLVVAALAASVLVGAGSAVAQDAPDYSAQCDAYAQWQDGLDAQVAQFDATIAAQRAQLDAYDAVLGPEYDLILANYRAQLTAAEATFDAQAALAQTQINAGEALFGC